MKWEGGDMQSNSDYNEENSSKSSVIDKALSILEIISEYPGGIAFSSIADISNLRAATIEKIIRTLIGRGYISRSQYDDKYLLDIKSLELGISGFMNYNVVDMTSPHLKKLSTQINETCFLGVYHHGNIVYLYKSEGNNAIQTNASLGSTRPAYCTSLGKVLLANKNADEINNVLSQTLVKYTANTLTDIIKLRESLTEIRERNIAYDNEEIEEGLICVASAIFNYTGEAIAAISIAGPVYRMKLQLDDIVPQLLHTAQLISRRLGYVKNQE